MAPERINCQEYWFAADIWSLGITIAESALGKYPIEKDIYKDNNVFKIDSYYLNSFQKDLSEMNGLSEELKDFVKRCCRYRPEDRATPEELLKHPFIVKYNDHLDQMLKTLEDKKVPKFVHISKWLEGPTGTEENNFF